MQDMLFVKALKQAPCALTRSPADQPARTATVADQL